MLREFDLDNFVSSSIDGTGRQTIYQNVKTTEMYLYVLFELGSIACLVVVVGRYMDSGRKPRIAVKLLLVPD